MIFHVDVNSAFLSWSAVKRLTDDPAALDLRTIPSAVGGDVATRHGIITAKSIPAKKYNVQTGEPVAHALNKCPDLLLVPSDFQTYREYSRAFIRILEKHAEVVEQVSIDEAFLLVEEKSEEAPMPTPGASPQQNPMQAPGPAPQQNPAFPPVCRVPYLEDLRRKDAPPASGEPWYMTKARQIKNEIRDTLGFTVNVGISENRLLAKMASDFSKPDKIHTLFPEEVKTKMWPLPIGDLYGCGKKSADKLKSLGISTIGDAARADLTVLKASLGEKAGEYIHKSANGRGREEVSDVHEKAKSYSNETTTLEDITAGNYERTAPPIVHDLAAHVSRRLKRDKVRAGTVTVSVKTAEFKRHSRQKALPFQTNEESEIEACAQDLLRQLLLEPGGLFDKGQAIRLIGVGTSGLDDGEFTQGTLFDWAAEKKERDEEKAAREAEEARKAQKEREEKLRRQREEAEKRAAEARRQQEALQREAEARQQQAAKDARREKLAAMMSQVQKRYGKDAIRRGGETHGK